MPPGLGLGGGVTADPASGLFASTPLLLDTYPNAHRAYSVRKLRTEYTGHAMKIRVDASSDRVADVAFDDDGFVSASSKVYNRDDGGSEGVTLATFVSTDNEVYVHTWYDQSGEGSNGPDLTPSPGSPSPANQPKLYTSNSLITDVTGAGTPRAALLFDGADRLNLSNSGLTLATTSVFTTFNITSTTNSAPFTLSYVAPGSVFYFPYLVGTVMNWYHDAGVAASQDLDDGSGSAIEYKRRLFSFLAGSGSQSMVINGTTNTDGSPSSSTTALGGEIYYVATGTNTLISGLIGKMQEFIVYDSNQASNNTGITSEINTALEVY